MTDDELEELEHGFNEIVHFYSREMKADPLDVYAYAACLSLCNTYREGGDIKGLVKSVFEAIDLCKSKPN